MKRFRFVWLASLVLALVPALAFAGQQGRGGHGGGGHGGGGHAGGHPAVHSGGHGPVNHPGGHGPVRPNPVHVNPVRPNPVHVNPVRPNPVHVNPVRPPVHVNPVRPPVHVNPVRPNPVHVNPVRPNPVHVNPVRPNPVHVRPPVVRPNWPGYVPTWNHAHYNNWNRPVNIYTYPRGFNFRGPVHCHPNYISTGWIYFGVNYWYSPGIGYRYVAPVILNNGPITIVVQEYVTDPVTGQPVAVTMYYNAYRYGGVWCYYDVFGNFRTVNW